DLLAAFADEDIARWNPGPTGPESAAEFMASRNDWSTAHHASWAVADASDRLVGSVSLHKIDPDQADAEVGYWTAPWARRRGQAARSVVAASRFAFAQLGLHRVTCTTQSRTPAPAVSLGRRGSPKKERSASPSGTPTASTTMSICTLC
ncbi:MAG: GNAT family N-acetyltransferase, partial [Propionibacteriales bacterium]|nr:GNAT family N-acetyltransferase [Propionibacteriales bacterium]